ncbi:MAG: glycosyltransferase [Chitinophagales bacterium]
MKLTVIIVNYNVKYFLEQALLSVQRAAAGLAVETIVVDNASVDGSAEWIREKFRDIQLIANKENVGFSKANNQGIAIAKGKYVLLLNPDTIVQEDTFAKTIAFMEEHPYAGGLGVKMLDGKGVFLPESKRGLPTPSVAFYKIFGFANLFPKSKTFGQYHLGYLDNDEIHEVEVLSGAFMLMRKSVLDEIGYLDETFFMYGEDVDLSYRILLGGYKNYYYPDTRIIHYKGESTKKGSLNYVKMFYGAMGVFAKKHFSNQQAGIYNFTIQIAIFLKAFLSLISHFLHKIALPLVDALLIFSGMYLIKDFWEARVMLHQNTVYPLAYLYINVPIYTAIWLVSMFFSGGYDKPLRLGRIVRGILVGTLIISAVYGFLPEHLRFSRSMILLGTAWSAFAIVGWRLFLNFLQNGHLNVEAKLKKKAVIVGRVGECKRVQALLHQIPIELEILGYVLMNDPNAPNDMVQNSPQFLSTFDQLTSIVPLYQVDEIIFCGKDLAAKQIMDTMVTLGEKVDYKIVPQDSQSIIGSNDKNTAGDLYTTDMTFRLNETHHRRNKRLFDLLFCFLMLLTLPIWLVLVKKPFGLVKNWIKVLLGQKTWVGYEWQQENPQQSILPTLKSGILSPLHRTKTPLRKEAYSPQVIHRLNMFYAKDYTTTQDWKIIWEGRKELGDD